MKKILFTVFLCIGFPLVSMAQMVDDVYFVPSKEEPKESQEKVVVADVDEVVIKSDVPTSVYTDGNKATVVVRDRNGRMRDVDEYNRRYEADDYNFSTEDGTLYVDEKPDSDLDGEWVHGFDGTEDDYEYATRIIRFRNPRYAVSISSPLYWDIVYGLDSWMWNVYTDGIYAYAFPTFSNRLWWDWRYNSFGWYGYPYYYDYWRWSFGWIGWWGPHYHWYAGPHWSHWHHGPGYWGRPSYNTFTTRRSYGSRAVPGSRTSSSRRVASSTSGQSLRRAGAGSSGVRSSSATGVRRGSAGTVGSSTSSKGRVVGTRASGTSSGNSSSVIRRSTSGAASSSSGSGSRSVYTRPSSGYSGQTGSSSSGLRSSTSTYSRGSSTLPTRSYNQSQTRQTQSYSSPVRSSNSSSRSSYSSGSTVRSGSSGVRSSGSRSGGGSSRR